MLKDHSVQAPILDIGECIYCGDKTPPLTREHVVPRGLGGNESPDGHANALVLQNASCAKCQLITQGIEENCLRTMMDAARAKLGMKKKKRTGKTTTAHVERADGTKEELQLDWSKVPGVVAIPSFYEAGALTNKPMLDVVPCDYKFIITAPAFIAPEDNFARVGLHLKVESKVFAQMLAKIAIGVAVARFGVAGFVPFVRNFILAAPNEYGRWVGGYAGSTQAEPPSTSLHTINLTVTPPSLGSLIIVNVRLFAEFGAPTNYVVVGRLR